MALRFLGQGPKDIALITGLSSDEKPVDGAVCGLFIETDTNKFYRWYDEWIEIPVGGSSAWGNITGTLSGGNSIADDASAGVSSGIPANGAIVPFYASGSVITTGNTGTAQLRLRSETTAATTIKAGTIMRVRELP